jgi:hypothetical protein
MNRCLSAIGLFSLLISCTGKYILYVKQEPKPRPSEGKALVNFVRPHGIGSATRVEVWDSDKLIGISRGAHCFQYECYPGKHLFIAWSGYGSPVEANLVSNSIYYILLHNRPRERSIYLIPLSRQHPYWRQTLEWQRTLVNYTYDQEALAYNELCNRTAIQNYMLKYKTAGITEPIGQLRPEDGVLVNELEPQ